ncbi:MAG TPA: hypothetical protein VHA12_00190 [Candidatus Nanoarchaeia archaeon]|nr:hypothetical protein [Candidatus Nanoarchaeia archaeon]
MDKEFEKWLLDFNKGREAIKSGPAWGHVGSYNENEKDLLLWYLQYESSKKTNSLVKATWILAGSTIILAIATIALVFVA